MWRIEVPSPKLGRERSFLHFITTGPATGQAPPALRLHGQGMRGALGAVNGQAIAVLFASAAKDARIKLGGNADLVVIAGLEPGKRYRVTVAAPDCELSVARSNNGNDLQATAGGFVRSKATGCLR
jgi:hypothetical protein